MSPRRRPGARLVAAVAASAVACGLATAALAGSVGEAAAKVLAEKVGPAVVHVRLVIGAKASYQGQTFNMPEQEGDVAGVVVDPSGLVLAGSPMHMVRSLERQMEGLSISLSLGRPRVRLAGDPKDLDAVLVAQDPTLGLAYFQVVTPPGPLAAVDLSVGTTADVGDELYGASRMDRNFDDALAVHRARVAGRIEQPRAMGILRGEFREHGLPLFRADGTPAGVFSIQMGVVDSGERPDASDMLGGLLPLDLVRASLAQARKRVDEALAKARASTAETPPTPAPDKDAAPAMDPTPPAPPAPAAPGMG